MEKKEKAIILLGAGFAIPFGGPSCSEIRNGFKEHSKYGDFAKSLFKILDNNYKTEVNFETFLSALENLLSYYLDLFHIGGNEQYKSVNTSIYDIKEEITELLNNKKDQPHEYLWNVYHSLINDVIYPAIEYYDRPLEGHKEKYDKLSDFIKFMQEHYNHVKIYTTNYDRLIPNLIGETYDSSVNEGLDNDIQKFSEEALTYWNLHGSFYISRQQAVIKKTYGMHQLQDNAIPMQGGNPGESLLFFPIIAGHNKTQRAYSSPFSYGFNVFSQDCNTCDTIITIGYSFNDTHINTLIKDFCKKDTKIQIINYDNVDDRSWFEINGVTGNRKITGGKGGTKFEDFLLVKSRWNTIVE